MLTNMRWDKLYVFYTLLTGDVTLVHLDTGLESVVTPHEKWFATRLQNAGLVECGGLYPGGMWFEVDPLKINEILDLVWSKN